ncbi:hypothetical protein [Rhodoplanes sp. Z2-YC6860]|uniref:hypothetical protein n=1 Tax=Rhodoplanes sp. Z2-YC6860 TaxID=674703 RepID=UPI00078CAF36|nr:hypothetical protein [Rhodoplanes sp. Z2-YC6860]AMN42099.1 methyltransferase FkbM [Rhodoplanes sp. Z2-YC6860]
MTAADAVPVVLFLFNRPASLARVVDILCRVRPQLVLAIADGPRPDHPEDIPRCIAARKIVERLDGSCRVIRHFAETNLGCDPRIRTGLTWAFEHISEAIVLEDDVVPDPSFFPWCAQMLDRYRDEPRVMHVSGRNHLGRWTQSGDGHCLLHRASAWGWATWRRAWQRNVTMPGTPDDIMRTAATSAVQPIVLDNFLMLQELTIKYKSSAWDTDWEIKKALLGGLSVVPSVNMVANIGFGPDSTHTHFAGDIGTLTPVGSSPLGVEADRCVDDGRLERWQMLFELMASYREPSLVRRLARSAHFAAAKHWSADRRLRHHLAPFREPHESLAALEHFCAAGAPMEPLRDLMDALRRASNHNQPPRHTEISVQPAATPMGSD